MHYLTDMTFSGTQETADRINSLDFHRTEDLLVTAGDDDSIRTYNIQSGLASKVLFSKKYGVGHIRFTHDPQSVIYASTKVRLVFSGELTSALWLLDAMRWSDNLLLPTGRGPQNQVPDAA
jgi:WD40 repeat protein